MSEPDRPVETPALPPPSPVDPALLVQVTLTEARYLQMQAAAAAALTPQPPLLDLSPLGR
jgi:hypothetical protein